MVDGLLSKLLGPLCAGTLVAMASGAIAASDAPTAVIREFSEETASLMAATTALFDRVEADLAEQPKSERAFRFRIIGNLVPANAVTQDTYGAFPADRGPVEHLTGYRITWYPVDRLLGVVDFMGTYDGNKNLVCGFVTWDLSDPDDPKLEHLKATYVDLQLLAARHPEATHEALLNANCAHGSVAPNFEALVVNR